MGDKSGADLEWRALVVRAGLDPDDPYSYRFSGARLEQLADEYDYDGSGNSRIQVLENLTDSGRLAPGAVAPLVGGKIPETNIPKPSPPLAKIGKTKAGKFRVLMGGTSKTSFDSSANRVWAQHLKNIYGDAGTVYGLGGVLGGSYDQPYQGWSKQHYGGFGWVRAVGSSSSSTLTFIVYGDTLELEFSRETDSEAVAIRIDGTQVGTTPAPGAQAYSIKQTFTGLSKAGHTVTVDVPTSGKVYFECYISSYSDRTGIEVLDATYGGSSVWNMKEPRPITGSQIASIPVVGSNGVQSWVNRPNVDLFWLGWLFNDAGSQAAKRVHFEPTWNEIRDTITTAGQRLMLAVEMAGHYALPGDSGYANYNEMAAFLRTLGNQHTTVLDYQAATIMDDLAAYGSRYFQATDVNPAAGTYTGEFTHETSEATGICLAINCAVTGVPLPKRTSHNLLRLDALTESTLQPGGRTVVIDGAEKTLAVIGTARTFDQANLFAGNRNLPIVRDSSAINLVSAFQSTIYASGTSDQYGTYLSVDNSFVALNVPSGTRWVAARVGGLGVQFRATTLRVRLNGAQTPQTDAANDRTLLIGGAATDYTEPIWVAFEVEAANGSLTLVGTGWRIYELSVVDSNGPVAVGTPPSSAQVTSRTTTNTMSGATSPYVDPTGHTFAAGEGLYIVSVYARRDANSDHCARGTWLVYWDNNNTNDMLNSTQIGSTQLAGSPTALSLSAPSEAGIVKATLTTTGGSGGATFTYTATRLGS